MSGEFFDQEYTATVKNTFIDITDPRTRGGATLRRCNSLPHTFRLASPTKGCPGTPADSSASTDVRESDDEVTSLSSEARDNIYEIQLRSPRSAWEDGAEPKSCPAYFGNSMCTKFPPITPTASPTPAWPAGDFCMETRPPEQSDQKEDALLVPATSLSIRNSTLPRRRQKLSAKADSFRPVAIRESPAMQQYKEQFEGVVHSSRQALQSLEEVAEAQVLEGAQVWTILIRPRQLQPWHVQKTISLAKKCLLDAAAASKCIYVMGYCGAKAFAPRPQGFQGTLAAMGSATHACWHLFKKGFCRHGNECIKQHPVCTVPIIVFVDDSAPVECQRSIFFKEQVAELAWAIGSEISASPYHAKTQAFPDKNNEGWSVEITVPQEELMSSTEYLLAIAKNAIYAYIDRSNYVYLMSYENGFIPQPNGFTATFGDMKDKSCACWDMYSRGQCHRDVLCRWQHPEFFSTMHVHVRGLDTK